MLDTLGRITEQTWALVLTTLAKGDNMLFVLGMLLGIVLGGAAAFIYFSVKHELKDV